MPKVGKKEFPYTPKGMAAAKSAAKKSGSKVEYNLAYPKYARKKKRG